MVRLCWVYCLFSLLSQFVCAQEEHSWTLQTSDSESLYVGAPVANGILGILPWKEPFSVKQVVLNHVFDTDGPRGVSRVLRGLNPFGLSVQVDGVSVDTANITGWQQTIDMKRAFHTTQFTSAHKINVAYTVCALRNMPYAGLVQVSVKALDDVLLRVAAPIDIPQEYAEASVSFKKLWVNGTPLAILQGDAFSKFRRQQVSTSSTFLFDNTDTPLLAYDSLAHEMVFEKQLKAGDAFTFSLVGAVCSSRDFLDAHNEAERQVVYAAHEGVSLLLDAHCRAWDDLWQGDIIIEGDEAAQQVVRFALFNLYGSCREGSGLSISPMGLSSLGYNGHVFWDAELWMYPPLLLLNQGIATSMIDYRINRMEAARQKAMAYGYQGAMFPWESDDCGEESTPTMALTGVMEHHITADVGIACWNYYRLFRDEDWLRQKGYPLLCDVANFCVSRATRNVDGSYSVRNVVGADEYANGVDDNAFTNAAFTTALNYACKAAAVCGYEVPKRWQEVAQKLQIHRFPDGTIREYDGYNGELIKQADVNLLSYPLGYVTDKETQRRNMAYYLDKIDTINGPAMSYSIFSILHARMGNADEAYRLFQRCYLPNWRPPFGVLAETATSQNPYFMTGAGGLLQTVIFGFCGLQLTDQGVVQQFSVLPKHWRRLVVKGVGARRETYIREQ